ncbi:MAG: FHA domain-containing protein [Aphanothece sp. CMT-3BRIN-NPC111]|jgi:serine/threonine-protein kinase|nr:FHA domain-containing protein [Aphanothece sp. CMT-3BRIN-NPC111]
MIGQLLDRRYRVLESLAAGGFGQTYIAEDTRIPGNPKCVVKQLKPASNDPNTFAIAQRLFRSEAETLAKLGNHSQNNQIPRILGFFDENQEFYLVQEFIEGHTLAVELTPGKKLSEGYVIELLQNVLPILEFIHQQKPVTVIHRDIKPANIIRRKQDSKLVLIDFGAVKEIQAVATTAQTQQSPPSVVIGTRGYMPPEQGQGAPRPSSDIYALGMIAIQALTGLSPDNLEKDSQTGEILWQHQASVSPGLAEVLTKMTRYHFKDRYQSATEVLQALQQLNNPIAPTAQATTPTYKPTEPITFAATNSIHELTLEWVEAGGVKTQIIRDKQPSKIPGAVRIGRDPQQCDIVLSHPTVSGLHAEIYFNPQQQSFYLRSLRPNNPPMVNGQRFPTGEVMLDQGSTLRLGELDLRVSAIALQQYPAGYTPTTPISQPSNTPPQPVAQTLQPHQQPNFGQNPTPVYPPTPPVPPIVVPPNPPPVPRPPSKLPLVIGVGIAAVVSVIGGYAFIQSNNSLNPSGGGVVTQQKSCTVAIGSLNVRATAGGDVIGAVTQGTSISPTGNENGIWVEISAPKQGWVGKVDKQGNQLINCPSNSNTASQTTIVNQPATGSRSTKKPDSPSDEASSSSSSSSSNKDSNASYQKGFDVGTASGSKNGKADGAANGGQGAMHIEAACDKDGVSQVTNDEEYIRGYLKGCETAYREAFNLASAEARSQTSEQPSDNSSITSEQQEPPTEVVECVCQRTEGCGEVAYGESTYAESPCTNFSVLPSRNYIAQLARTNLKSRV